MKITMVNSCFEGLIVTKHSVKSDLVYLTKVWGNAKFLAHPAFRPKMSLCHRVASVVCRLSSVHKSQEMLLLPQFLSDFNPVWFV